MDRLRLLVIPLALLISVGVDVSDKDLVLRAVGETVQGLGRVDILVNNVGIHVAAPFEQETRADWLLLFEVNVLGTVFPSQAVVPYMLGQGGGRAAVLYLASDEASWCTGQAISVDGGFSILL